MSVIVIMDRKRRVKPSYRSSTFPQKRENYEPAVGPAGESPAGGLPSLIEPQFATLVAHIPADGDWSYKIKFDGYGCWGGSKAARRGS